MALRAFALTLRSSLRYPHIHARRTMSSSSGGGSSGNGDLLWIAGAGAVFGPMLVYQLTSEKHAPHTEPEKKEMAVAEKDEPAHAESEPAQPPPCVAESPFTAPSMPMRKRAEELVVALQAQIVDALEKLDPDAPRFKRDKWTRDNAGGYGMSCVFAVPPLDDGFVLDTVLEKAGVNVSVVHGNLSPAAVQQMRAEHETLPKPENNKGLPYFATGVSLVIHPRNPHAPTVHANFRYFEVTEPIDPNSDEPPKVVAWWFGGGSDLTPVYLYQEDAKHFHQTLKNAAEPHGTQLFPAFKKWCDEYFYITHRKEARGIGGVFWDDLSSEAHKRLSSDLARPYTPDEVFNFVKDMGESFVPAYVPIVEKRSQMPYTPRHRRWQLIRRGRYVEFNLMIDRGTKFGLMSPAARIESIFMSLPDTARWEYMTDMADDPESEEAKLVDAVTNPREWI